MQNVAQGSTTDNPKIDKVNVHHDLPSTPHSTSNSSPAKSETETYSEHRRYMSDSSDSEEDSVSEVGICFIPMFDCFSWIFASRLAQVSMNFRETSCGSHVRVERCCSPFALLNSSIFRLFST